MTTDARQKGSFYWFAPEELTLVKNPAHPLFDKRALDPPDLALVASLAEFGVEEAIRVQPAKRYVDEKGVEHHNVILVANGRRRTIAARHLAARQKKDGEVTIRIKGEYVKGTGEAGGVQTMVIANAHRRPESTAELARKAVRCRTMGRSEKEIANLFGVEPLTVKNWLALGTGAPEVLAAVERGEVSATAGYALASLDPEDALAVLPANGAGKLRGTAAKAKAKAAKARKGPPPADDGATKRLSVKELHAMLEAFTPAEGEESDDVTCDAVKATLEFILGIDPRAKGLAAFDSQAARLARKIRA